MKTRVLEITGEPILHGGQEAFIFNFLDHLETDELQVDLLTPYYCDNDNYRNKIKKTGQLFELKYEFLPGKSRKMLKKPLIDFLSTHPYDVVHIHSGSISLLAYFAQAARKCGVKKVIVHSHSMGIESIKHKVIRKVYAPLMEKSATHFFACSMSAGLWKFSDKVCRSKLTIIKNGIDLERFAFSEETRKRIRNQYEIPDGTFVVGHVGRFSYEKNHAFLLDVYKEFLTQCPNSRLLLVGDGDLMGEIRKKAEESGISDHVIFVGNVNHVYEYYNAMDVFCLPSLFEGFPIVGVEAQASGLNVLMSDMISDEASVSSSVSFLSINDAKIWSSALVQKAGQKRNDVLALMKQEGFDIGNTVQTLMKIYTEE